MKITVAGLTLNGVIKNDVGKPLTVIIAISKEGLKTKLMNYSQIVVKFFETYRINSSRTSQTLFIPNDVFDKMKAAKNYMDSLKPLVQDFVSRPEISKLPDINLFNIDCAFSRLQQSYPTWTLVSNGELKINVSKHYYSFSFMFGDKTFYGSISYSPWGKDYFSNFWVKRSEN